jgi:DNA-binding transcriptional ArsR family regulator
MNTLNENTTDKNVLAGWRTVSENVADYLKALSHENRLLLCILLQEERCVTDLQTLLNITQPTLSQQLGILRRYGLIKPRRAGKRVFYKVTDKRTIELLKLLERLYCPAA